MWQAVALYTCPFLINNGRWHSPRHHLDVIYYNSQRYCCVCVCVMLRAHHTGLYTCWLSILIHLVFSHKMCKWTGSAKPTKFLFIQTHNINIAPYKKKKNKWFSSCDHKRTFKNPQECPEHQHRRQGVTRMAKMLFKNAIYYEWYLYVTCPRWAQVIYKKGKQPCLVAEPHSLFWLNAIL